MPATIIDNGGSGYSEVGTWADGAQGYLNNNRYAGNPGTGGTKKARWTFTSLTASTAYKIAYSWFASGSLDTAVPWRIYDSDNTTVLASGTINQQTAPTDYFSAEGIGWKRLSTSVTPTGNSLRLEIDDNVSLYVLADVARLDLAANPDPVGFDYSGVNLTTGGYFLNYGGTHWEVRTTSIWNLAITGTDATIRLRSQGGAGGTVAYVSVDGGAESGITDPAGDFTTQAISLFSGLTDAAHQVKIRFAQTSVFVERTTMLVVTGSSAAVGYATGYTQSHQLLSPTSISTFGADYIKTEGGWTAGIASNMGPYQTRGNGSMDAAVRFKGTCTAVSFFTQLDGSRWALYEDNVKVDHSDISNAGGTGWVTLNTSGAGGTHDYKLHCSHATGFVIVSHIMASGITTTTLAANAKWLCSVDSITRAASIVMTGDTEYDTSNGYAWKLGLKYGKDILNDGYGGRLLSATPCDTWGTTYGTDIEAVVLVAGTNDLLNGDTTTTFRTTCDTKLADTLTALPTAKVFVFGTPDGTYNPSGITAYNGVWDASVTANGNARLYRINPAGVPAADGLASPSDGTHPSATGYDEMVATMATTLDPIYAPHTHFRRRLGAARTGTRQAIYG